MADPIAGNFGGLTTVVSLQGSRDYVTTKGGYQLANTFEKPFPTGDAFPHSLFTGRELKKLYVNRRMIDGTYIAAAINNTPISGTAVTLVTAGASLNTAGLMTQAGTTAGGIIKVTLAGSTTSTATTLVLLGTDVNGNVITDKIAIPSGSAAAATFMSSIWFTTVTSITNTNAAGSGSTCGVASIAGTTTSGAGAANMPLTFTVSMNRGPHPVTGREVFVTFSNCMVLDINDEWEGGKGSEQVIDLVVQNPNTDISWTFI